MSPNDDDDLVLWLVGAWVLLLIMFVILLNVIFP